MYIENWINHKIQGWKSKLLFVAAHDILFKFVIAFIPTYTCGPLFLAWRVGFLEKWSTHHGSNPQLFGVATNLFKDVIGYLYLENEIILF